MIEVDKNLFVGAEIDEHRIRGQSDWYVIHACKEPFHRQALGYSGRAASKDHPEYLIARREGRLILNLVDVDNASFVSPVIIDAALEAIAANIATKKVLVHCNQGQSRSPAIAFLYLLKHTTNSRASPRTTPFQHSERSICPFAPLAEWPTSSTLTGSDMHRLRSIKR